MAAFEASSLVSASLLLAYHLSTCTYVGQSRYGGCTTASCKSISTQSCRGLPPFLASSARMLLHAIKGGKTSS
ncbi:hypothetical protein J3F83DRAFT_756456, partial [Trichoderma novae-zelandiae]